MNAGNAETIARNVEAEIAEPEVLRRSRRERWFSIPDDYHVYQVDTDSDIGEKDDLTLVKQAMQSVNSTIWKEAIEDELQSMSKNEVRYLVNKTDAYKSIGYKWVFKTKRGENGKVARYKTRLVAKGYNQKDEIYMLQPDGFAKDDMKVCKLKKSIYDLK